MPETKTSTRPREIKPTSITLTEQGTAILHQLADHLGLGRSRSGVIELALRRMHQAEGLELPKGQGKKSRKRA